MKFLDKIENIDRRLIYLAVILAVILPLLFPVGMDVQVTKPVEDIYNYVEELPDESIIWMGFDYTNSTRTECDAQTIAFLHHVFRKNHKVFITSTRPEGNNIAQNVLRKITPLYNKEYGIDYALLGYKPGNQVMMLQICQNVRGLYNTDVYGTPITDLVMMNQVKNAKDIDFFFTSSSNASFDGYVQVVSTQYNIPMGGGSTAVSVPQYYIYIDSGQIVGILGGLKGAAEYEKLIGIKGLATSGMDAQSFVHLFVVILILISNIIYFLKKYLKPQE
ncbi:MAG: hypothetical protein ACLFQV_03520 [Vulcanimicrobiota bacterium]